MKKLLVTAIGAAVAFGAFADAVRFEKSTAGTVTALSQLPGGTNLWSEPEGATNTYAIGAAGTVSVPQLPIASGGETAPTKALDIKTTFGKPLSLNAVSGGGTTNINDGLYFDSLVKFTVCEDAPADTYTGAKIIMWLQEVQDASGNATGTNLIVRAGYLSGGDTVAATPTNYVCALPNGFNADAWHRVTIKAIADITTTGRGVPGFAIYLDQSGDTATSDINAGTANMWDGSFPASELTEAASLLNDSRALFPSLDVTSGNKATLTSASFDGTGSITDLIFTDDGPAFAKDMAAPKANVTIGTKTTSYSTLAEAVAAVSGLSDGQTATLQLIKGMTLEEPLTVNADFGTVIIDFAGNVWTNTLVDAAITNNAAALVITNSVGNGGIYCTDRENGAAIYNDGGLTIYGGTINGLFEIGENGDNIEIFGGSFLSDNVGSYLADGKVLKENTETDLYDVIDKPNTWAGLLGEAVDGAYTIDDADDVLALQNGVLAGLATADVTFKQTANIDMTGVTDFWGIGWFTSSDSKDASITASGDIPFAGTYDGQGYTISNVTIVRHNYAGVFNNVSGTVKNLTVQDIGFSGTCSEWGCAIVGNAASGSLLENLTATTTSGFNWGDSANHNVAGVVVRPIGAATIRGCVNNANISATAKRVGGIASFVGSGATGTVFDSCTNTAAIVSTDGTRGVGGILGCAEGGVKNSPTDADTIIRNCVDFGSETAQASGGYAGAIVGSNWNASYTYTDDGGNTFKASTVDCGYAKNVVFGRAYAVESTINNEAYLTTVKAADIAKGGTYTLLTDIAASETPVITLDDAGDSITFKLNGHQFLGTVAVDHDGVTAEALPDTQAGTITYAAAITDQWAYRLGNPVNGAYEIDNLAELKAFQAGVAVPLTTAGKTFKLTADIALDAAWEGIGVKGGKDLVNGAATKDIPTYEAGAFCGTFDGQNHTISNFQMENGTDYGGFFNSVNGATISNLKITYKEDKLCANSSSTGGDTGATFVGVARNSTLQNLTALAGTVTTVSASKDMAGIVAYLMRGSTVDSCTNELNVASLLTAKARKSGGIALITQDGETDGTATIRNCKNSGTVTLANAGGQAGGIVGYVGTSTTIVDCENTAAVKVLTVMGGAAITMQGTNKGNATVLSSNLATNGLNFATVDGNVATFVADSALALNGSYKVMATGATATFAFAEAGTIAFDTALATPTYAITAAEGLTLTDETVGTVKTYTAAAKPSGIDPATNTPVEIEAASEAAATNAVTLVTPDGVDAAAYKNLFDFTVKEVVAGEKYEVSIAGIKEEVQEAVSKAAVDVLTSDKATTVDVPAGLCYKVTTYTALGGDAVETKSGTSNGTAIPVAKPGTTQGFIKVELATKPLN